MRRDGSVLVVALFVLFALAALAFSAAFLSGSRVTMAGNVSRSVTVQYQAQSGVDATLARLSVDYPNWPCWASNGERIDVPAPDGFSYRVTIRPLVVAAPPLPECVNGVGVNASVPVMVSSISTHGEAESEARAVVRPAEGAPGVFGQGFVAGGDIRIHGGGSDLHVNLHAGGMVNADGHAQLQPGFTAAAGSRFCRVGRLACVTGAQAPVVPFPVFHVERERLLARSGECSVTLMGAITLPNAHIPVLDGITLCLERGTHLTVNDVLRGTSIIGHEDTRVTLTGRAEPAPGAGAKGWGVRVASGQVILSDSFTSFDGENTVIAVQPLLLRSSVSSGDGVLRSLFVSEGDIHLEGQEGLTVHAMLWSGGAVELTGMAGKFSGTVVAARDVRVTGGLGTVRLPRVVEHPLAAGSGVAGALIVLGRE